MTEAASMITANPVNGPRKPGSAGKPAGSEVRVAVEGRAAAAGEIGRVLIRGAGVITGYASGGRPGVIDADGWLDTSDLGYLDEDGYLFLVGRSDDVINRGGEKIYPREIEEILLAQPGVRSAAVIGAADDVLGERPVAYVVPDADAVAGRVEAELRAACAQCLPRHKQPSEFWLLDEMPLGPTGKISRRRLKEAVPAASAPAESITAAQ
jgi:acyl-CoA synthetase (AMP-forming)/AMP-acid ligase II